MNSLQRIFPYLLLSPLALPLVISGGLYYPYLFPKVILFYALTLLTLAVFASVSTRGAPFYFARLKSKITWIPAALLILAYVASLAGLDFYKSFWSIFGRGDGLLMLTLSTASFYLLLVTFDKPLFRNFIRTVAVVGSLVAVWGIVEWFFMGGRIGSSIGNAAFLAGYLALTFFTTLATVPDSPRPWRLYIYAGAGLQLVAILLTATRGTLLALLIAGVATLAYVSYSGRGYIRRWSVGGIIALIVLASGFILLRDTLAESSFAPVARIAQVSLNDPNVANRLFVWSHMVEAIGKRPMLGYGAEHVAALFDRFYDPSLINEDWFDRSHNAYLDYAVQFGMGGTVLYVALIGLLLFTAIQYRKRDAWVGNVLALAAITYAVQNFFVFDTISSWWLFLALLAAPLSQQLDAPKTTFVVMRQPQAGATLAVVLLLLIIPASLLPLVANIDLIRGYYYHLSDIPRANAYFKQGLALKTYGDLEYGYQLHTMYTYDQASRLTGADRVAAYEMAKDVLRRNYERFPYDARTAVYLADVLDSAPPEEPTDSVFVRAVVDRARALSPKRAQAWYVLANLSIGQAKDLPIGAQKTAHYAEAIRILDEYIALVPKLSEPHYVLADLYFAIGEREKAIAEANLGNGYYKEDISTAKRAALFYERIQNWERAAFYLQEVVRDDPQNFVFYYDLAKMKYLQADFVGSLEAVHYLRAHNPAILETDPAFLSAITAYEQSKR